VNRADIERLQAIEALLDQQKEQYRHERGRWLQEQEAQISKRRREPIPKNVKMHVWQRDGGRCVECRSKERLEYDHIIPLSKGGSNTERNIQLLCERHNRSKGSSIS
jgi:5-methylcytosine-specific restriction endonuclease McrA